MRRRLTHLLSIAAIAAVGAGCGDDDDAGSGPASVVPDSAPVYVDVTLRPEGEAGEQASAALGKVLNSDDPGQELITRIEQEAQAQGDDLDYEADIEPWLGEKFAVFLTTIGGDTTDSEGAFVFEATDIDAAYDYFKNSDEATGETGEYEGVEYLVDGEGDWLGAVDDFIVGGEPNAFKAAVDAADGDPLSDSDEFDDAVGDLPGNSLATLYVPPEQFLNAVSEEELDEQARPYIEKALGEFGEQPVVGDLTASADAVTLDFTAGGEPVETEESGLLGSLPADAWLGFGFGDIGASVQRSLDSLEEADIPGVDAESIQQQLGSSGIDLQADVIDTLGDAALYVTGTTHADLGGALVIETTDPAASGQFLNRIQALIRSQGKAAGVKVQPLASANGEQGFQLTDPTGELKQPIRVVQSGDKIVVGYGAASVGQALAGGASTLSSSEAFTAAQTAVGDLGIDAFLSFAPVFQLAESEGAAADPEYQLAKPYLDALDFLALGSGAEDDGSKASVVIGLK